MKSITFLFLLALTLTYSATPLSALRMVEPSRSEKQDVSCLFCETVVSIIEWEVRYANATVHELEEAIEELCSESYPPVKQECLTILHELVEIVDMILKGIYPVSRLCANIGMCPPPDVYVQVYCNPGSYTDIATPPEKLITVP